MGKPTEQHLIEKEPTTAEAIKSIMQPGGVKGGE